jgi:hypothetical protein
MPPLPETAGQKSVRLFDIILAFQAFGGKSMRATDAADALTSEDLDACTRTLRKLASHLHRLASEITKRVGTD